ncbi:MAG: hypothetical protein Q9160_004228 [Pyrenula sp. 1 TL-2023]
MNVKDMTDQITPQHCEEPPYFSAKTLASDEFSLRRMRSSHYQRICVSRGQELNNKALTISQTLAIRISQHLRRLSTHSGTHHHKSKRLSMLNEPASDKQRDRKQDRHDRQPILSSPPKSKQEAHAQDQASNLASHNVEATEDEQSPNQRRPQISSRQCNDVDSPSHVCYSAFSGVEGDGFDSAARTASGDGVAEFMEGDD